MGDESDSPLSEVGDNTPSDSEIEAALRDAVIKAYKQEDFENLTLKRVRIQVTEELGLPEPFLKVDEKWKSKSKEIVNDEVTKQEESPKKAAVASPPKKQTSNTKSKEQNASVTSTKRKRTEKAPEKSLAKKQRKKALPPSSDIEEEIVKEEKPKIQKESDTSSLSEPEPEPDSDRKTNGKEGNEEQLGPESELSDVLDEAPKPKLKRKSRDTNTSKPKAKTKSTKASSKIKSKPKSDAQSSASSWQDEEVKKLQGQLAKCGIKRLWGKELARFNTPAEKVTHLKGMLRDVGMGGRFSEEKARQIREERELKADLEAIQEGEERWGKGQTDQPRRLVPKALMELQGLADDEEDSD